MAINANQLPASETIADDSRIMYVNTDNSGGTITASDFKQQVIKDIAGGLNFKGSCLYTSLPLAQKNDYYYCSDGNGTDGPGYYIWNGIKWDYLYNFDKTVDNTLSINGAAADAKETGDQIASLKEDIEYFQDDVTKAFNATENLYNPHSFTNKKGIALTIADGTEYADSTTVNAITTGYFDTHEGDVWRFYRWNTAKDNIFGMEIRVHWFNENEEYISGAIITGEATAPTNARHLRFTEKFTLLYPSLDVMVTKNYSFDVNGYVPYGITQLKETFLPKEKVYEQLQKNGTLHSGESWVLENNNIMARKVFVLSGIVNSFSTLEMGHGTKTNSPSSWVVVDNENITVYSTPTNKVTLAHGLIIKNTIQIIIEVGANYKAKITLLSNGEKYNTEQDWDGNIGNIFVNSINTELANCTVSWTCKNYSSPIWAYGDSYFGMTNKARWIAHLLSNGYGSLMVTLEEVLMMRIIHYRLH